MKSYFISDLHLSDAAPQGMALFESFIQGPAAEAKSLYILGDLFDYWIGDDIENQTSIRVAQLLKKLSSTVPIYFMGGNRDFLLGSKYAQLCGMQILLEPSLIKLNDSPTLLMHGDSLCTNDVGYMWLRRLLRSFLGIKIFPALPKSFREKFAQKLRQSSKAFKAQKNVNKAYIMDVDVNTVKLVMKKYQCKQMIHGHVHKAGIYQHDDKKRYVMADWREKASILSFDHNSQAFELSSFPKID